MSYFMCDETLLWKRGGGSRTRRGLLSSFFPDGRVCEIRIELLGEYCRVLFFSSLFIFLLSFVVNIPHFHRQQEGSIEYGTRQIHEVAGQ